MAISTIPGYPRIGANRELKWALEGYWSGKRTAIELEQTARKLRHANWTTQRAAGLDLIPVNDFSFYDHVLDTTALVGAVPYRYGWDSDTVDLDTYFAMARGRTGVRPARAQEMTKWFDTNYHYLVPEFVPHQRFRLASDKPFAEFAEARAAGIPAKPTLLGPITFLLLGKGGEDGVEPLSLLDALLPSTSRSSAAWPGPAPSGSNSTNPPSSSTAHPPNSPPSNALTSRWPRPGARRNCWCRRSSVTSVMPIRR